MRRSNYLFMFISLFLLAGCNKPYFIAELVIRNESGLDLFVESSIESSSFNGVQTFMLRDGDEKFIAQSKRYSENFVFLPLEKIVENADAYVSISTISESSGEKQLIHTWNYSDKDKDGHELFNEKSLSKDGFHGHDGGNFQEMIFTILPEDLESN